ncbi:DUF4183 domain-containing protein [Priestia flexa]|uniref:DUF4183 domain-containing protein n=1 Tax=Priestia flexa TaxID=86664 RepID=UPI001F261A8F|nr:DUF4183 domain-containing protein [Priestia flexa]UIR31342.1 DUF4183 domain-containing protein [Priestia flexa]
MKKNNKNSHSIRAKQVTDWTIRSTKLSTKFSLPPLKIAKTNIGYYYARADGQQRIFTNKDQLPGYGNSGILSPDSVSYTNLFVNGMLQPPAIYKVDEGILELLSTDVPSENTLISLQFITIYLA